MSSSATDEELKKAYKRSALRWHPDRNQGDQQAKERFQQISEAYEVLGSANSRGCYDAARAAGCAGPGHSTQGGWSTPEQTPKHYSRASPNSTGTPSGDWVRRNRGYKAQNARWQPPFAGGPSQPTTSSKSDRHFDKGSYRASATRPTQNTATDEEDTMSEDEDWWGSDDEWGTPMGATPSPGFFSSNSKAQGPSKPTPTNSSTANSKGMRGRSRLSKNSSEESDDVDWWDSDDDYQGSPFPSQGRPSARMAPGAAASSWWIPGASKKDPSPQMPRQGKEKATSDHSKARAPRWSAGQAVRRKAIPTSPKGSMTDRPSPKATSKGGAEDPPTRKGRFSSWYNDDDTPISFGTEAVLAPSALMNLYPGLGRT